jgi:hypothetical protein
MRTSNDLEDEDNVILLSKNISPRTPTSRRQSEKKVPKTDQRYNND